MASNQARVPRGAAVFVDAHDTVAGAYVFRNGLRDAALQRGLRPRPAMARGTSARLGGDVAAQLSSAGFDIGPVGHQAFRDLTAMRLSPTALSPRPRPVPLPALPGAVPARRSSPCCRLTKPAAIR